MDEKPKSPVGGTPSSDSKLMAGLSYVWIVSIFMLLLKKDDEFVKFHARQGFILFILSFIVVIPVIGWILVWAVIIVDIIGLIKALSGDRWKIPLVGDLAEKINL